MTEKDLEVIEILNKWGPEAMRLGLITEKEVYQALGSSSDKGGYNYDKIAVKAGGGMMNINEMIRPIGMAGGGLMDQVLDLDTLVKIVKLEGALPNKDTDDLRKMSPIEIEILYNDTFGEGN